MRSINKNTAIVTTALLCALSGLPAVAAPEMAADSQAVAARQNDPRFGAITQVSRDGITIDGVLYPVNRSCDTPFDSLKIGQYVQYGLDGRGQLCGVLPNYDRMEEQKRQQESAPAPPQTPAHKSAPVKKQNGVWTN
ncbi:MAG: hypothetical protein LBU39_00635 [Desulfobulbaceae bacterium]|jgi:hypothetical protein|nr:hypothetical protein [Desulfobulbaceae bacterium]